MTYAGAKDGTETEMAEALHFELGQDDLHPAFNAVDLALNSRDQLEEPYEGDGFELRVVNAVWG